MIEIKNVLSLFDGMSCGKIALNKYGIKYENYFASEIEKSSIFVTKNNYPNTKHLGDIRVINTSELPNIDLLIGGSPCQSFSFAGKKKGMSTKDNIEILTLDHYLEFKKQNFEFEGQSYLFWEYVRILKETKPKYFLLENVVMDKKWENVISDVLNVRPIEINSRFFSCQNRRRLYWVGKFDGEKYVQIKIEQPEDKNIKYSDISSDNWFAGAMRGRRLNELGKRCDNNKNIPIIQYIESRKDDKINCLSTVGKDNIVSKQKVDRIPVKDVEWRYLTRNEMESAQTVPINYTISVSLNQASKMLGNGWTIDVIVHIFSYMF